MEVRSRRVGGANYQVPREVRPERKQALSMKWIIEAARNKKGAPIHEKLADEIISASKNAGEDPSEWWMKIYNQDTSIVPDLANGTTTDAYDSGIIDPTKVVRSALENAAAAAITLLMTEAVIHDKPDEKKKQSDPIDMMNMM
jgi:predicted transcriptional regulator